MIKTLTLTLLALQAGRALAASPSDFFCNELPPPQMVLPTYFALSVRSCDGKQAQEPTGLCTETVACVYVTAEIKAAALKALKKNFEKFSREEKIAFLQKTPSDWLPTILSCKPTQVGANGVAQCPMPEKCKGDVYAQASAGIYDGKEYGEAAQRQNSGQSKIFQGSPAE